MADTFLPGVQFADGRTYLADRQLYVVGKADTQRISHLIAADPVPVAFVLRGLRDVTIDLGGATLFFQGKILPFVLENCKNVILRNFTLDYRRAAYTQCEILDNGNDSLTFRVSEGFPYICRNGEMIPVDDEAESNLHDGNMLLQPFDPVTRAPAFGAGCMLAVIGEDGIPSANPPLPIQRFWSEAQSEGVFVWHGKVPPSYRPGQLLAIVHETRSTPGIYAADCQDIVVENVRMKRVAGFGIHSYFCHNFTVRGLVLKADDNSDELVSINADGIHMIGLSGRLLIENCVLENMLDDGGNFHGYFTPVIHASKNRLIASLDFPGGDTLAWHRIYRPGDELMIYRGKTIARKGTARIAHVQYAWDAKTVTIELEENSCPVKQGDHLENRSAMPEIVIRNCRTGRNRPRGFLISTWRKALIENCHFYNCAAAIHFTGDNQYWYESGPVEDVTIRNNIFENCGYCGGTGSIRADPQFDLCDEAPYYHKNIRIQNNIFLSFQDTAVVLNHCDGVLYQGNRFIHSCAYPAESASSQVLLNHCANCRIEE